MEDCRLKNQLVGQEIQGGQRKQGGQKFRLSEILGDENVRDQKEQ